LFDGSPGRRKTREAQQQRPEAAAGKASIISDRNAGWFTSRAVFAAFGIERAGARRIMARADDLAGVAPMQDWLLILTPIATAVYFLVHPGEFSAFMDWFARLLH
jgi:hypothetical protein